MLKKLDQVLLMVKYFLEELLTIIELMLIQGQVKVKVYIMDSFAPHG